MATCGTVGEWPINHLPSLFAMKSFGPLRNYSSNMYPRQTRPIPIHSRLKIVFHHFFFLFLEKFILLLIFSVFLHVSSRIESFSSSFLLEKIFQSLCFKLFQLDSYILDNLKTTQHI